MRAARTLVAALLVLAAPLAQASSPTAAVDDRLDAAEEASITENRAPEDDQASSDDDSPPDPDRVRTWSNTTDTGPVSKANVSGQADADPAPPSVDVLLQTHIEADASTGNQTLDHQAEDASPQAAEPVWESGAELDATVDI